MISTFPLRPSASILLYGIGEVITGKPGKVRVIGATLNHCYAFLLSDDLAFVLLFTAES